NVFLPNITRRFCAGCRGGGTGFVTPFIMQNLGTTTATINVQFVERGSTAAPFNIAPVIVDPGKSKFVDPNSTLGLQDGKAYAVTLTADQPIAVVVNTHDDAPTSQFPAAYSADGISDSASTIYAPYLAKNTDGISNATAMGYTALTKATTKFFLPNVTRTLGGATGWTTPILLQSTNALTATLSWFRFSDGVLVNQQTVPLTAGAGVRVDPRINP